MDSRSVHSYIVGEHGDSEIAVLSSTNISGIPLDAFCAMRGYDNPKMKLDEIAESVKNSAYDIIEKKQPPTTALPCLCGASVPVLSAMNGQSFRCLR